MDNQLLVPETNDLIPLQVAAAGQTAARRFIEFFTANIRNRNTRQAYARAVIDFFRWCEGRGLRDLKAPRAGACGCLRRAAGDVARSAQREAASGGGAHAV